VASTWRNALATSPQFSVLLDVRRPSDGPATARVLILHGGGRVASRRPGGARPRASPWGRLRGGHTPSTRPPPGAIPGGWPSRRSARPARAWLLRLTRSSGRPSNRPDHSAEGDTDQRKLLVVGQRPIPLLRVVSFTETTHRRFRCGTVHDRQRVQVVAMGCTDGGSVTLCEADRVDRWNVTPVTPRIHRVTLLSCARPFDTELSAGFDGLSDVTQGAVVFVHGIISSPAAWTPLARLLENDTKISHSYRLLRFEYRSPKFDWRPDRRIPDYNTIADSLSTFIDIECADYTHLVLVGHSQGGLIVQRYLARMLAEGRGVDLRRIRRIVLLACPNNGSELLLILRKSARFWTHPQERELRPPRIAPPCEFRG
jgi:hypothetical protein